MTTHLHQWIKQQMAQSRAELLLSTMAVYVVASTLTRLTILALNYSSAGRPLFTLPVVMLVGFILDVWISLAITLPLTLISLCFPDRTLSSRAGRWFVTTILILGCFGILYLGVVEAFFFDEFSSRFNYIAVDYLIYPHEVFINIWDSYPVPEFLTGTFLAALAVVAILRGRLRAVADTTTSWKWRGAALVLQAAIFVLGLSTLNINSSRIGANRVLNEITANGVHTFFYSALTNEVDYASQYACLSDEEAQERVRRMVSTDGSHFLSGAECAIERTIDDPQPERRLNVVLVFEESFGSSFVGTLHPEGPSCTPYFDSLVAEGTLFSHVYATGNRTVRGIEAGLAGFPPIPGESVVKRPGGKELFTLPSVLKEKGYQTAFIYGGRSYFDNLGTFARSNGFDRVIDQTDFKKNTFSTIWGVCDEDLFDNTLVILDSMSKSPAPFFATLLTVSNHRPYLYPPGRIPFDPAAMRREFAVHYADYSLHRFLHQAQTHSFFDSTLFIVLGDHGARVYGSMQIPMDSYEIPVLFYAPHLVQGGLRISRLGSQLDLPTTILDVLNCDYSSEFFGRSLLREKPGNDWALMSHNRDVAMFRNDTLAVLGIRHSEELWTRDSSTNALQPIAVPADSTLLKDAIAYYQTAYEAYRHGDLHPSPTAVPRN